jgi:hypothetical protein
MTATFAVGATFAALESKPDRLKPIQLVRSLAFWILIGESPDGSL